MIYWGVGSFENGNALDWVVHLLNSPPETLRRTLAAVAGNYDVIDVPEATEAVAAAEVVAAGKSRMGSGMPGSLVAWTASAPEAADPALTPLALAALDRVTAADSVLYQVWVNSSDAQAWLDVMAELRNRLEAPAR